MHSRSSIASGRCLFNFTFIFAQDLISIKCEVQHCVDERFKLLFWVILILISG